MINKLQKFGVATTAVVSSLMTAATVFAQIPSAIEPGTGYSKDFGLMINSILSIVMVVALLLVLLYLILGGIEWITSGGDKGKTESARNKITSAIIGIIILAASYALVTLVAWVLGFASFSTAITAFPKINP